MAGQSYRGVGLYFDQDLLVPTLNQDRDYTMGLAAEFFWAKEKGIYPLDGMVRRVGNWLGLRESSDVVYSFKLGSVNYTPDDLSDNQPILNDRPYSSLIYLSNKRVLADRKSAIGVEVMLGLLGTGVAKVTQRKVHGWWRAATGSDEPVDPQGWSNQISDGGELTARIRFSNARKWPALSKSGLWDVSTNWGFALGYQTNLNLGAAFRLGRIRSPFWSLPFDPVNRGNFLPANPGSEWYFWAAYRAHLVAYDALLQGQFRSSEVTFSADQIERLVHDGAVGLTIGSEQSQITISVAAKSAEIRDIDKRRHYWGNIHFIFHF